MTVSSLPCSVEGGGVDLVQEQCAPQSRLEEARFGPFGIGEGASLEAEQLRLQQRLRDGGAVDLDKRPLRTGAAVMNDACHQPFPRAGFPTEQQGRDERIAEGVKRR
jgi:hypothetical protein